MVTFESHETDERHKLKMEMQFCRLFYISLALQCVLMEVINAIQGEASQLTVKLVHAECYKVGNNATFEIRYNGNENISQVKLINGTIEQYSASASNCINVDAIITNVLLQCLPNKTYLLSIYNSSVDLHTQSWNVTITFSDGSRTVPINVTMCKHDQPIGFGKKHDVSLMLILIPLVAAWGQVL